MRRSTRPFHVALALAVVGGTARAEEPADARIEYHVPPSCPSDAAFAAQVSARAPRLHRVFRGESRVFVVDVTPQDGGYRGELTSIEPSGTRAAREMFGASCDEVVGALGLVLALAVDPTAPLAPPPAPAPPPTANEPAAPAPSPPPAAADSPPAAAAPREAPAETPRSAVEIASGAGLTTVGGVGPGAMVGVAIFAEAGLAARAPWRPTLRAGAQRAWSGTADAPNGGSARFTWTVGTLDACPLRFGNARLSLSPCARLDAGVLAGSGADIAHPRDDARFWLDAGALARGEWAFAGPLFADAEAGALVAITRPRFHFDVPDSTIHQPAPVGAVASLHLGGRFP